MSSQNQTEVGEVRVCEIYEQLPKLPMVFMLKAAIGNVIKVSFTTHYLNASFYKSRSELTWDGVARFKADSEEPLKILSGIYYFRYRRFHKYYQVSKITRNLDEMKQILVDQCKKLDVKEAVIEFNNYGYTIYTEYRIKKAPLIHFTSTASQGRLFFTKIPQEALPTSDYLVLNKKEIYNHTIHSEEMKVYEPIFTTAGILFIISSEKPITITSPDHPTVTFYSKLPVVFYHYRPQNARRAD